MRTVHGLIMASALAVVGLAACSSGSSPAVAKLATTGTSTTVAASAGSGGSATGKSASGIGVTTGSGRTDLAKMEAYAGCMRSHGVPSFPDPTPGANGRGGGFEIRGGPGTGLDPNSPAFQAAQQACRSLLPNGGVAPSLTPAQQQQFLSWAACIRAHGVPNFPDPQFNGGAVRISGGPASGINPDSSAFKAAQQACKSKLPGGFGAAG